MGNERHLGVINGESVYASLSRNFRARTSLGSGAYQEQLGRRVGEGVRLSKISRLEKGIVTLPHLDRLIALARALEVSLGELLLHTGMIEAYHRAQRDSLASPTTWDDPVVQDAIGDLSD